MAQIGGHVEPGYGKVADAFRANFSNGAEVGAACSVMVGGHKVVDLWGGHRDRKRTKPWERDTLVPMFSTTKGMSAATMAVAHSRGFFDFDELVATYWPEFAAHGKDAITVRQLLDHEAGLAVIGTPLTLEILGDHDRLGEILAAQTPGWAPGTAHGYHAQSLGWLESQLLSRVDPAGRTIGRFLQDEVASVLGEEIYIGLPAEISQEDRVARFVGGSVFVQSLHLRKVPWPTLRGLMNPRSETSKAFMNPKALTKPPHINKPELLRLELPSVNGTGTARAVAAIYGDLATGGERLGMKPETLAELRKPKAPSLDRVFGIESAFSLGFMKPFPLLPFGSSSAFGHTGTGGSFGFADPERELGYGYVMNRCGYSVPVDPRDASLRAALDDCIA